MRLVDRRPLETSGPWRHLPGLDRWESTARYYGPKIRQKPFSEMKRSYVFGTDRRLRGTDAPR